MSRMNFRNLISLCLLIILISTSCDFIAADRESSVNEHVTIGILAQELSPYMKKRFPEYNSYIAASYAKHIQSAGAKVVPIRIGENKSYYEEILGKVNGVLLPGGNTYFTGKNGYADAGEHIYRVAERINRQDDYFPVSGVCLGFEFIVYIAANRSDDRFNCSSKNQALPLEFTPDCNNSRLFKNAPNDIIAILREQNVTANFHIYCITEETLKKSNLTEEFHILSFNHDVNNFKFISTLEHKKMPIYGVQFHPEKNAFEWIEGLNIPHSPDAIKAAKYFADFLVDEAKKNEHHFSNQQEETQALINNYNLISTNGTSFEECYMFK